MRIGFEAKRIFHNSSGLGNYGRNLITQLGNYYQNHQYFLYNTKTGKINFKLPPKTKEILPDSSFSKLFCSLWRSKSITKQLKSDKLDLFHGLSNELPFGIKETGIKSIVTIHDLIFKRFPQYYKALDIKFYDAKTRYACENADGIIAISEQTKKDIIDFYGISSSKVKVIYQGCAEIYKQEIAESQKTQVKNKFKLPEKFVLNVGTIEERKNLKTLLKSIAQLEDIHLVVVGSKRKQYFKQCQELINSLNLTTRVHFLSNVADQELAAIYQIAKLFVYPSFYEGFGIPLIEALNSKTPIIAAKGSCLEEAGGKGSIYCNPDDVTTFSEQIFEVLSNDQLQKEMILKGLTYARQFDDDVIAKNIMNYYLSIFDA